MKYCRCRKKNPESPYSGSKIEDSLNWASSPNDEADLFRSRNSERTTSRTIDPEDKFRLATSTDALLGWVSSFDEEDFISNRPGRVSGAIESGLQWATSLEERKRKEELKKRESEEVIAEGRKRNELRRSREARLRCPYCRDSLTGLLVKCTQCSAILHEECYQELNGRCPILGCDSTDFDFVETEQRRTRRNPDLQLKLISSDPIEVQAYKDNLPVGKITIQNKESVLLPDGRRAAQVDVIEVDSNYRRQGIATALYLYAAQLVAQKGLYLSSDTRSLSEPARAFWDKQLQKGRAKKISYTQKFSTKFAGGKYNANSPPVYRPVESYVLNEAPPQLLLRNPSDESLRQLERQAQMGDPEAIQHLRRMQLRVGNRREDTQDIREALREWNQAVENLEKYCQEMVLEIQKNYFKVPTPFHPREPQSATVHAMKDEFASPNRGISQAMSNFDKYGSAYPVRERLLWACKLREATIDNIATQLEDQKIDYAPGQIGGRGLVLNRWSKIMDRFLACLQILKSRQSADAESIDKWSGDPNKIISEISLPPLPLNDGN